MKAMPAHPTGWIFDLDGTLTIAQHDFDAIRAELDIPQGEPILEYLARLPASASAPLHRRLDAIERELAASVRPQPGCAEMLAALAAGGCLLGVLTRNTRENALYSLQRLGVSELFDPACVLGRHEAPAKPDPGGILNLLQRWQLAPNAAVMVGDFRFDLEAGRAAGVATIHFDPTGRFPWPELTDRSVRTLTELASVLRSAGAS